MTETQLEYFTSIVELGSFSEAALELDISQSSISKQIMQLEDELQVSLFDRSFRRARLSQAGELLYQDAIDILRNIKKMKEHAHVISSSGLKKISILALPVIGHYNFYIPISLFESEHSELEIELNEIEEPEMYRKIERGDYDAAITYFNPRQPVRNGKFFPLADDEMVLVCNKENPLCNRKFVTPEDIDGIRLLSMQKYTCISQLYELYFQKHNTHPNITFRARPETIMVGAEAKQAPALLTRIHTQTQRISGCNLIPFSPALKGILGIIINQHSQNKDILEELAKILV